MTAPVSYEQSCINDIKAVRERIWGSASKNKNIIQIAKLEKEREAREMREREERREAELLARIEHDSKIKAAVEERRRMARLEVVKSFVLSGVVTTGYSLDYQKSDEIIIDGSCPVKPTMEGIALAVLDLHPGISLDDVKSTSRFRNVMLARREVIATIRKVRPDLSFPVIGRFVNKDHTSCLHAIKRYEQQKRK